MPSTGSKSDPPTQRLGWFCACPVSSTSPLPFITSRAGAERFWFQVFLPYDSYDSLFLKFLCASASRTQARTPVHMHPHSVQPDRERRRDLNPTSSIGQTLWELASHSDKYPSCVRGTCLEIGRMILEVLKKLLKGRSSTSRWS